MAAEVPTRIPDELTAGDTFKWRESLGAYPASEGWVLHYAFVNAVVDLGTFDSTPDGDDFLMLISATSTAVWTPGTYTWQAWVDGCGDERITLEKGTLVVHPDLATSGAVDIRAHCEKALEAIEAVIEARATKDQEAYSIEGRSLSRTPLEELRKFRDYYRGEVARLRSKERLAQGRSSGNIVQTHFMS